MVVGGGPDVCGRSVLRLVDGGAAARHGDARIATGSVAVAKASADLEPVAANVGRLAQAVGGALEDDLAVAHHIDTP
jgi:hypothetical protein